MMTWKLNTLGMNSTAEQYLVFHKFGTVYKPYITISLNVSLVKRFIIYTFVFYFRFFHLHQLINFVFMSIPFERA